MSDARDEVKVLHYAGCRDCDLWKWCNDKEEAIDSAMSHGKQTGHSAYTDTVEPFQ